MAKVPVPRRRWLFDWLTSVAGGAAEREEEEGEQGGMNGRGRRRRPLHRDGLLLGERFVAL